MRVALVCEDLLDHQDPVGSIVLHLVEHLEAHGHSCLLLTPSGIPLLMGRTRVVTLDNAWAGQPAGANLVSALSEFQPDILHSLQPVRLGVEALGVARELGVPAIASFHSEFIDLARQWGFGITGELMWSYFKFLHDLSDLTLVPSFISKMQLRDLGFGRVGSWSRGVDIDLFSPRRRSAAWRRRLSSAEPDRTLLIYAGRLTHEKHVELLLPVIKANLDCRLAIAGDGPELAWLRDHFEGTPTLFTGKLDQGELAEAYASADAFIHSASTRISPAVTLEAMASGLPVLAPHSGSIVDFAVHGENALLYLPGQTEQAASYVSELAQKPGLRQDLGRIARQTAVSFNWQTVLDKLLDKYSRLVERQRLPFSLDSGSLKALQLPQPIA